MITAVVLVVLGVGPTAIPSSFGGEGDVGADAADVPAPLDMKKAHKGLGLTTVHFNALVELLQQAMSEQGIGYQTQNRLLALLAPMHRDVVEIRAPGGKAAPERVDRRSRQADGQAPAAASP